ncbi:MarR family winged helix-turn-helix transcriptional regulator [Sphingomonas sp. dw_22]|uniref:MarR family winged helix-turn-helix transcriptional regulator n=1 Tax=Sphingomonas sp. dw_22 TaxID=2721175 RepID=UPI001BD692D4|nr:MarR family winged helix-turn-helix transcriptional regulator [Sphingomonas sp. dw_22]
MCDEVIGEMVNSCMLMRTRLISRVLTNIYDEELRPFGINSAQFALLVVISKLAPATAAEIGRFHHQDKSTLTRNLKLMFAEGWIEEDAALASGRSRPIVLTQAGDHLLHAVSPAWKAGQARASALIGEAGADVITNVANGILYPRKAS